MAEMESTSLSMPGSSHIGHQRTGFGPDEDPPRLMFTRWGPLIAYFGVSGQASMRRCKIVDQRLEKLMQLYIRQMSQVERPVLGFLLYSVVEASCTYPQRAYLWTWTYSLASWHTCRYRSRIYIVRSHRYRRGDRPLCTSVNTRTSYQLGKLDR